METLRYQFEAMFNWCSDPVEAIQSYKHVSTFTKVNLFNSQRETESFSLSAYKNRMNVNKGKEKRIILKELIDV